MIVGIGHTEPIAQGIVGGTAGAAQGVCGLDQAVEAIVAEGRRPIFGIGQANSVAQGIVDRAGGLAGGIGGRDQAIEAVIGKGGGMTVGIGRCGLLGAL